MSNNLELWNGVSRVPPEHLKAFDRGTFKGTAIKPAWAYKTMTEHAGPCGQNWSIAEPQFTLVDGVKGEKLVYCVVTVHYMGGSVVGVGGDKVIKYTPPNERYNRPERWDNDDEAFKKAYTDALTNALVKLGVGADIHMGLWDGNKYADETTEAPAKPKLATVTGEPAAPKAASREPYDKISKGIKTIQDTGTNDDLTNWYKSNVKTIEGFPADWHQMIMEEFSTAREALRAKAA